MATKERILNRPSAGERDRRRRLRNSPGSIDSKITIESKMFEFKVLRRPDQNFVWLSDVDTTSLGPFSFILKVFCGYVEVWWSPTESKSKWRNRGKSSSFESEICYNSRGSLLRVSELLPDGRHSSICISGGSPAFRVVSFCQTSARLP